MIEKDFKDRIPKHPGRIRLVPVEGQQNTFDLSKADEPTEPGTALNREAFNSIIQSRLTGRYYSPSVTKAVYSSSVNSSVNPIPSTGWNNVTLTGAVSGEYIITASNSHNTSWSPEKAVDGDAKTSWTSAGYTTSGNTWWQIYIPVPIIVTKMKVTLEDLSDGGASVVVQGSNNGTSWSNLMPSYSYNGKRTDVVFDLNNSTEYRYYRLNFATESEYSATIYSFEITEFSVYMYDNRYTIDNGVPVEWAIGQRILIQTPSIASTAGVFLNSLNGIHINTLLAGNKRYELRYTGSSFTAKEV